MKKLTTSDLVNVSGGHECPKGTTHTITHIKFIVFVLRYNPGLNTVFEVVHPGQTIALHECV